MKKALVITLAFILLFSLSACGKGQKSTYSVNPRPELKLIAQYPSQEMMMAGTVQPNKSVDIALCLEKDTGIDPITGNGNWFILEEYVGGVWVTIPRPDFAATQEGYVPAVGHPVKQTCRIQGLVQHPGHYRILKDVIIGHGEALQHEYYAAEFDVTD